MPIFFAILILGVIQGLTEFLPVSSSGHLVFFSKLFGIEESLFVSIILHVATLLSIIIVLRRQIFYYLKHPLSTGVRKLFVATIPTCLIVLILLPIINASFKGAFLPFCFMLTAFILAFTNLVFAKKKKQILIEGKSEDFPGISYKQALLMGVAQGFAVFPGISRSGSTICAGMLSGGDKNSVAEFSFLMSIPIILASAVYEGYKLFSAQITINWFGIFIIMISSFVFGILS